MSSVKTEENKGVQAPKEERKLQHYSNNIEGWILFALLSAFYMILGALVTTQWHVISFEALDQLNRIVMMWHNEPAKLSAVGFDYAPLATLSFFFVAIPYEYLAATLLALPIVSGLLGAWVVLRFNDALRALDVAPVLRYLLLLVMALSPPMLFFATTGTSVLMGVLLFVASMSVLLYWYSSHDVRYLMSGGLLFGLAVLASYVTIVWFILSLFFISATLLHHGAKRDELVASLVAYTMPAGFALTVWTFFSYMIMDDAFAWIDFSSWQQSDNTASWLEMASALVEWIGAVAPISVFALILLILGSFRSEDTLLSRWMAVILSAAFLLPMVHMIVVGETYVLTMRYGIYLFALTMVALGALYYIYFENKALPIFMLIVMALSIPYSFSQWENYESASLEYIFVQAIQDRESQEGKMTSQGNPVGIANELNMASYIRENLAPERDARKHLIIVDNAQSYGVMVLTGRPRIWYDRLVSDKVWKSEVQKLDGPSEYVLINTSTNADAIAEIYPENNRAQLLPIHANERYTLYRIRSAEQQ